MMAVEQNKVPEIEEVLISSDSEDEEIIVVSDDEERVVEPIGISDTIDQLHSSNHILYDNGDYDHLHQLLDDKDKHRTQTMLDDEDYEYSDDSNMYYINNTTNEMNVNLSDKENLPMQDTKYNGESAQSSDSDNDQFYIAEDCTTKNTLHNSEKKREETIINADPLSNNCENIKVEANANSFIPNHNETKSCTDADKLSAANNDSKKNNININVDKPIVDDENTTNLKQGQILIPMNEEPEELMIDNCSNDESEQNGHVITLKSPKYQDAKFHTKRFLKLYCEQCKHTLSRKICPTPVVCNNCDSKMAYQCKICLNKFDTYWKSYSHLKHKCQTNYFWRCPECDYGVRDKLKLEHHIQQNHNPRNEVFRCKNCQKICHNKMFLDRHLTHYCKNLPKLKCQKCQYKNRDVCGMKKHVLAFHELETGGYIDISKKVKKIVKTRKPKSVPDPNSTSVTEKPQVIDKKPSMEFWIKLHCVKCKLTFKKKAESTIKCKNCDGPLLYQCKNCKDLIKSLCGIYAHIDDCDFIVCKKCNIWFEKQSDAIKHKDICNKTLRFKCKLCYYKTSQEYYLKRHIRTRHNHFNATT